MAAYPAIHAIDLPAPPARSSAAPKTTGPTIPPPNPASEYSPIADPRSSGGAAATSPAVSVAESAITSIEYAINRRTTKGQCQRPEDPSTMPVAPEAVIASRIHLRRPTRRAASFPAMDAGTANRFTTAAMDCALHGNSRPAAWRPEEKVRNATIQPREPNSSRQCTAYPAM